MIRTELCRRLGIDAPVIQAPMASASCPELVAAVSGAGGLGMLSGTWREPDELRDLIQEIQARTDRPFGVNLVLEWDQSERLAICLDLGVRHISLFWGDPAGHADAIHRAGATLWQTVASAEQARRAVDAGADIVVAQGWEAGGHVLGQVASLPLVPVVVDAAGDIPVVAAGGIADGRGLAAALCLGAQAGWIGTRFLLSHEARIHERYRERLGAAAETDTVYTEIFDGGWPNSPHRVLDNAVLREWRAAGSPPAGARPGEGEPVAWDSDGDPVLRYSGSLPRPGNTGDIDAQALYAGQSVGLVGAVLPAARIVSDLVAEAEAALARLDSARVIV